MNNSKEILFAMNRIIISQITTIAPGDNYKSYQDVRTYLRSKNHNISPFLQTLTARLDYAPAPSGYYRQIDWNHFFGT
jgi:hypothetical protein